jgi:hypothetical protein
MSLQPNPFKGEVGRPRRRWVSLQHRSCHSAGVSALPGLFLCRHAEGLVLQNLGFGGQEGLGKRREARPGCPGQPKNRLGRVPREGKGRNDFFHQPQGSVNLLNFVIAPDKRMLEKLNLAVERLLAMSGYRG